MGTTTAYAVRRTCEHVNRCNALYESLQAGCISEAWPQGLETHDNLFPDLDYRIYAY